MRIYPKKGGEGGDLTHKGTGTKKRAMRMLVADDKGLPSAGAFIWRALPEETSQVSTLNTRKALENQVHQDIITPRSSLTSSPQNNSRQLRVAPVAPIDSYRAGLHHPALAA